MGKPSDNVANKAAVRDFTLSLGLVNIIGDLHSTRVPNAGSEEKFVMVCPTCEEPHKVSQEYVCSADPDHGPFTQGDCGKAKDLGETLVKMSQAQIDAAKQSKLPKNNLELTIHQLDEVENVLIPSGNTYVFTPKTPAAGFSLLIEELKANPNLVFMGTLNLRNKDRIVRLDVGIDGNLVIQELEWFQDIKHIDAPAYEEPSAKNRAMGDQLIQSLVEPFEQDNYTKEARERLSELIAQAAAGELPDVPTVEVERAESDDLEARLEAMLAAQAKKKPAVKKQVKKAS